MTDARAYLSPTLERGRAWGIALNLYGLRSARNWGIGDFTDLRDAVAAFAALGADVVGVNPLHALHYVEPEAASPYAPTSRFFLNPIYIDVEAVAEFSLDEPRAAALRERVAAPPFAGALDRLRDGETVDYARVARAKWSALETLYEIFRSRRGERRRRFTAFVDAGGERLERFAVYEALTEAFAQDGGRVRGWLTWPEAYRNAGDPAVAAFAAKRRRRVDYFKWLQWIADGQLARASEAATAMTVGLYRDLAVGVDLNSADVWSDPAAYVLDETVGAPPDPLGPLGQNWGLPPPEPASLVREDGRPFRELLRANMAHAGALRLDHAMALMRLFRIPRGRSAAEGAYVSYPFESLLRLLALESEHSRCVVVGEDLGTVPPGFRERMETLGVLSYRLLLFERHDDGSFLPPEAYPALALATATTHDLPTLPGWAIGRDIDTRAAVGGLDEGAFAAAHAARRIDVSRLLDALRAHGELDDATFQALHDAIDGHVRDRVAYAPLVAAAYRYLASSPARLVLVQLDDALGTFDQINVPGTFSEYPNWRRKTGTDLARLASDAHVTGLAAALRERIEGGRAT